MPRLVLPRGERSSELPPTTLATVLVGDFGSGKTEIAVNLALERAERSQSRQVAIADLDLVNPYFRCREAREPLEKAGVRVVVPPGDQQYADLPILVPEIKGILQDESVDAVLDVGGDAAGCRVLAALAASFRETAHDLWLVVNGRRPFCDTPEGVVASARRIEEAAKLSVTGLVSNTHLMEDTTPEMVVGGIDLAERTGELLDVPVVLIAAMESVGVAEDQLDYPLLVMRRQMLPPWLRSGTEAFGSGAVRQGPRS